jgi:peptide/nickel transport system permease protein
VPKIVLLWTDVAIWLLVAGLVAYAFVIRRNPDMRATWRKVFRDSAPVASAVILAAFLAVTLLDSIHFRSRLPPAPGVQGGVTAYDTRTRSVLDLVLRGLVDSREATYSRPLGYVGFTKESAGARRRRRSAATSTRSAGGPRSSPSSPAPCWAARPPH